MAAASDDRTAGIRPSPSARRATQLLNYLAGNRDASYSVSELARAPHHEPRHVPVGADGPRGRWVRAARSAHEDVLARRRAHPARRSRAREPEVVDEARPEVERTRRRHRPRVHRRGRGRRGDDHRRPRRSGEPVRRVDPRRPDGADLPAVRDRVRRVVRRRRDRHVARSRAGRCRRPSASATSRRSTRCAERGYSVTLEIRSRERLAAGARAAPRRSPSAAAAAWPSTSRSTSCSTRSTCSPKARSPRRTGSRSCRCRCSAPTGPSRSSSVSPVSRTTSRPTRSTATSRPPRGRAAYHRTHPRRPSLTP